MIDHQLLPFVRFAPTPDSPIPLQTALIDNCVRNISAYIMFVSYLILAGIESFFFDSIQKLERVSFF